MVRSSERSPVLEVLVSFSSALANSSFSADCAASETLRRLAANCVHEANVIGSVGLPVTPHVGVKVPNAAELGARKVRLRR